MSYFISGPKDVTDNSIAINPEGGLQFNNNNELGIKIDPVDINRLSVNVNGALSSPGIYQISWCRKGAIAPNTYALSMGDAEALSKVSYGVPYNGYIVAGSVVSYRADGTPSQGAATAIAVFNGVDKPEVIIDKEINEISGVIYYDPLIEIDFVVEIGLKNIDAISDAAFTSYQFFILVKSIAIPTGINIRTSSSAKYQQKSLLLSNPLSVEPSAPYRTFDPINDPEDAATVVNSTTVANERLYPNVEKILKRNRRT